MSEAITREDCGKNVKIMTDEIKGIKDSVNDLKVDIASLPEKLAEKFDKRYAPKWVAKVWVFVFSGIGACLIIAGMTLIIRAGG